MGVSFFVKKQIPEGPYEVLTEYTLSNPGGPLSIEDYFQVNFDSLERQDNVYLSKDFGSQVFSGNMEVRFEMKINSFTSGSGFIGVGVSQGSNVTSGMTNAFVTYAYATSSTNLRIGTRYYDNGGFEEEDYDNYSSSGSAFTHYYCRLIRSSTVGYFRLYDDPGFSNQVKATAIIGVTENWSKLIIIGAYSGASSAPISGYIKNVEIISF